MDDNRIILDEVLSTEEAFEDTGDFYYAAGEKFTISQLAFIITAFFSLSI